MSYVRPLAFNIYSIVLACEPSLYSASEFSYSAGKRHPLWHGLPEAVPFAASLFLVYRLFTAFEMPTSLLHVYDILSGQLESTSHWLFPLDCPLFHGCSPRLWLYYGIVNAYRYRSPCNNSGKYIYKQLDKNVAEISCVLADYFEIYIEVFVRSTIFLPPCPTNI